MRCIALIAVASIIILLSEPIPIESISPLKDRGEVGGINGRVCDLVDNRCTWNEQIFQSFYDDINKYFHIENIKFIPAEGIKLSRVIPWMTLSATAQNENSGRDLQDINRIIGSQAEHSNTPENGTASYEKKKQQKAESLEDRIWREGISPNNYSWTPQTFSGFFYDFDNDVGTETLTVNLSMTDGRYNRTIDSGYLEYSTDVVGINYEYEHWGQYEVIGFLTEKYLVGYRGTSTELVDKDTNLIDENELRRVLIDSDSENTITSGSVISLEEGYELHIKEIDTEGNKIFLSLAKDGEEIDSKVISPDGIGSSTYKYEVDVDRRDVPIIMAHISNAFRDVETDLVTVDGIFQISDTFTSVESGDKYGEMEADKVSDARITMTNEDTISLGKGRIVNLFGDVGFEVADSDELRFAPIVSMTGTYELRGTVIDPSDYDGKEFTWNPYNFEGFYYDIDDDVGTENLTVRLTGTKIEEGDLEYTTNPRPVEFEFGKWGRYDIIGFMADKYFAGYNDDTEFTDDAVSIINEGELRKVLIDSDEETTISAGSVLPLKEGYELQIEQVDINGSKVYLTLTKDEDEVDSRVVTPSFATDNESNFLYRVNIGSETEIPIIAAHFQNVFRGTEADQATIEGIFQISDTPESVEKGEVHSELEIDSIGSDGITMTNDGIITLQQSKNIGIMDNLMFKVADNSVRNFAPVSLKSFSGELLSIDITEAIVSRAVRITIRSSNEPVRDAQVFVAGSSIGTTNAVGSINYTPESVGSIEVIAKKTGYGEVRTSMVVMSPLSADRMAASVCAATSLVLSTPSEVQEGWSFLITVYDGANQTPLKGAKIFFDDTPIGITDIQGNIAYSTNEIGGHIIKAQMGGYDTVTRGVTVISREEAAKDAARGASAIGNGNAADLLPSSIQIANDDEGLIVQNLPNGTLIVVVPRKMKIGEQRQIIAAISRTPNLDATDTVNGSIVDFDEIKPEEYNKSTIPVYKEMKANLAVTPNDFKIEKQHFEDKQRIPDRNFAIWRWLVTPSKEGLHRIDFMVSVFDPPNEINVFYKTYNVEVNYMFTLGCWVGQNYQWLIGALIGSGIILWFLDRKKDG